MANPVNEITHSLIKLNGSTIYTLLRILDKKLVEMKY
jgi:hypothetical protein